MRKLGIETRTIMGNDPPGSFTRVLHPRLGRHGEPAAGRDPGRPLGDRAGERLAAEHRSSARARCRASSDVARARALRRPAPPRADDAGDLRRGARARDAARSSPPSTRRASSAGCARHAALGLPDRPDRPPDRGLRAGARSRPRAGCPGEYEIVPNGVLDPAARRPGRPRAPVVFVGRHEPRKGLPVLLRAWPEMHRRTGARLRHRRRRPARGAAARRARGCSSDGHRHARLPARRTS